MRSVKIADLKNNLSRHLLHVRAGGDLVVLDRNTPVARVVPFDRTPVGDHQARKDAYWTDDRLTELEGRGTLARGRAGCRGTLARGRAGNLAGWTKSHSPVRLPKGSASAVALLVHMRRESTR